MVQELSPILVNQNIQKNRREKIAIWISDLVGDLLETKTSEIDIDASFLEMGADSLILMDAMRNIENNYKVKITIRQVFEELTSIKTLAEYIDLNLPPEWNEKDASASQIESKTESEAEYTAVNETPAIAPTPYSVPTENPTIPRRIKSETALEKIMKQQLQVMSKQLKLLGVNKSRQKNFPKTNTETNSTRIVSKDIQNNSKPTIQQAAPQARKNLTTRALSSLPAQNSSRKLSETQQSYLEKFIKRYCQRTQTSKQLTQQYRKVLADSRAVAGFRPSTKEMIYPIMAKRAKGSRFWDVDDNEYIDLTMGFGVLLFGHAPSFINEALQAQIQQGIQIGPQSNLAGEVAQLISELTNMERVAFCNSGTEAVMTALRLARTTTGRQKIARFSNSYHGHFDGILATSFDGKMEAVPMSPGVMPGAVEDILVLEYGNPQSLEILRSHASELAAVLVEPVQSRRPDLQPKEFLLQLREITAAEGCALIFDEVLTGFRIHPGGTQAWFGIQADIATYGKIVGGGMPIGVIAGKANYLNGIDGGLWNYLDNSYPQAEKTFFAGTFNKNHTGMALARSVLKYIKSQGATLQENLNQRTARLAQALNDYFDREDLPIHIVYFGSLFRFTFSGNLDLLFYHLLEKGVYIWEGRNCFLSTAHTDKDIDYVIKAVIESIEQLREGGFLPNKILQQQPITQEVNGKSTNLKELPSDIVAKEPIEVPLSEAQKQLWALNQIGGDGSRAYKLHATLELRGDLRIDAVRQAVKQVVERHEALRTIIDREGNFQRILPAVAGNVPLIDLSQASDRDFQIARWYEREHLQPFNLAIAPLWRIYILKLEEKLYQLVLSLPHILSDGWSISVILQEIGALYSANCQKSVCQLKPQMQFKEYLEWQEGFQQSKEIIVHQSYWLNKFAGSIPVLELPTDNPRPPMKTYRAGIEKIHLNADLTRQLKKLSQKQGCTLFMSLLSVYTTLLHRLTARDDLVVGIPVSGRSLANSEVLVGYCTHLLLIRSQVIDRPSFSEYLKQIKEVLLEAYEHQDYPFAKLLKQLQLDPDTSRAPIVTATFNLEPPMTLPKMDELEVGFVSQPITFNDRDIHFNITQLDRELIIELSYNLDLFTKETIERWLGHFQTLIEGILVDPQQSVWELPLLNAAEQHQILTEWNHTHHDYPQQQCVHQLFEAQSQKHPEATAVVFEDRQLTYRELNSRANQLARHLEALEVGSEVLVGICVEPSLEMLVGILGILKAGGAYVPIDPSLPSERITYILEETKAEVLLTQDHLVETLGVQQAQIICLDRDWEIIARQSKLNTRSGVSIDNLAYVIFTSGSTGKPKGVAIEHKQLLCYLYGILEKLNINEGASWALVSTFAADLGHTVIFPSLSTGGALHLISKERATNSQALAEYFEQHPIDCLKITPVHLEALMSFSHPERIIPKQQLVLGGEASNWKLVQKIHSIAPHCLILNHYGPTETTVGVTTYQVEREGEGEDYSLNLPLGRPLSNRKIYILNPYLQTVPVGIPGELHIGGDGLARGYLNRPELTAEKFIRDPFSDDDRARLYKTGDLARYLPDGNIEFLGRIDNQVKIRGFRIELGEIEASLLQHPEVNEAVLLVKQDSLNYKRLIAYIVPQQQENTDSLSDVLPFFLKEKLPQYLIPSGFCFLNSLPLTSNGKIDRRALEALELEDSGRKITNNFVEPRTAAEKTLADIWAQVLGRDKIGIHDNFFELGGDSILNIQIVARANQEGLQFSPLQLYKYQTIAELATVAGQTLALRAEQLQVTGSLPLTPIQHWFFEQDMPEPHHYNQSILLEVSPEIDLEILQQVLEQILIHHDALRLKFTPAQTGWQQANERFEEITSPSPMVIDLSRLSQKEQSVALEEKATQIQASLDIQKGDLMRVALFHLGDNQPSRLLLAIHHLAVDGVSWRILLEDVASAYQQLKSGATIKLPPKTTSYKQWAHQLQDYARSQSLKTQLDYWLGLSKQKIVPLPADYAEGFSNNIVASIARVQVSLDSQQTKALLQEIPAAYNTQINDVLLTALVESYNRWSGEESLLINLEGHGREQLSEEMDLSRTVGWFTSVFPVCLTRKQASLIESLKSIKEQLRSIPQKGIGYGILRYLSEDISIRQQLSNLPQPQINFNYLGQLDAIVSESSLWKWAKESTGAVRNIQGIRKHLLDVDGFVANGQLQFNWFYSTNIHSRGTIESLAKYFIEALTGLIDLSQSTSEEKFTPADFPQADLSQEELDELISELDILDN